MIVETPATLSGTRPGWASVWGVAGIVLLLSRTILRLSAWVAELFNGVDMALWHWAVLGVWVVVMGWTEGYQGFQLGYSRRVVRRAFELDDERRWLPRLLAPIVSMGLCYAPRARLIVSWSVVSGIALLVTLVRQVPQPWRGIVDAGVVVGLSWGLLAIVVYFLNALRGVPVPAPVARRRR